MTLIKNLTVLWRLFFAVPMVAFGVQHLIYLDFVTRVFPRLPAWVPFPSFLAFVGGVFLIAAGVAIMTGMAARLMALLLGAVIFVSFALLHLPIALANPSHGGLWTMAGKALFMSGGSFLVASSLPVESGNAADRFAPMTRVLEKFIPPAPYFLAIFLILCGILHFIYVDFVASLVPGWIPGPIFWTYFAGVALIAGGVGICVRSTSQLAAALSGLMIFLWVLMLHIPRAAADLHNSNETTAVFEALACSGTAFLVVATAAVKSKDVLHSVADNPVPPAEFRLRYK